MAKIKKKQEINDSAFTQGKIFTSNSPDLFAVKETPENNENKNAQKM